VKSNVDVLIMKLEDFEGELKRDKELLKTVKWKIIKNYQEKKINRKLIGFIEDYEKCVEYVNDFNSFQGKITFVSMCVNSVGLCTGLFIITKVSVAAGFTAIGIYFFQMFIPCVVGSMVIVQVS
jgi:cobalamin biosynthesis Co2+ chelatase CbiK